VSTIIRLLAYLQGDRSGAIKANCADFKAESISNNVVYNLPMIFLNYSSFQFGEQHSWIAPCLWLSMFLVFLVNFLGKILDQDDLSRLGVVVSAVYVVFWFGVVLRLSNW
jgi:hypothetical protein